MGPVFCSDAPIIPGYNDIENHFAGIAALKREMPNLKYQIMPWHKLGVKKYKRIGKESHLPAIADVPNKIKMEWESRIDALINY